MPSLSRLLATSALAAGLLAYPAYAQDSTGDNSPLGHVDGEPPAEGNEGQASGEPVETEEANAPSQEPAFPEQTRAPQPDEMPEVTVETLADDLPVLWAMEFLPDNRMLVTAKDGAMHIVSEDGEAGPAIEGVPEVDSTEQGGLLDIALSPDFEDNGRIYYTFSEPQDGGNSTALGTAVLSIEGGGGALSEVETIWRQVPIYDGHKHFGSRIVFSPDGNLFVGVGERSDTPIRERAQDLSTTLGKVVHLTPEGEPVEGNPFDDGEDDALPEIWSNGHRNIQSAALDGQGRLWTVEHGPAGGDELNRPEAGLNYGWPVITYGVDYSGAPINEGITAAEGLEQPVYYWDPVIGPAGMAYYEGEEFPTWQNAFLLGGLVTTGLVVVHLDEAGDRVAYEERVPLDARIRDVRVGPDGAVYAVTEDRDAGSSTILRLSNGG